MRSFSKPLIALFLIAVASSASAQSSITNPAPGTVLPSTTVTFMWTATGGATDYDLKVGTTGPGSSDIANVNIVAPTTSHTVNGLPTNALVYVELTTWTGFGQSRQYLYNDDLDNDGIRDALDANPGVQDAKIVKTGTNYVLTILGSGRLASLQVSNATWDSMADGASFSEMQAVSRMVYEQFRDEFDFIYFTHNQTNAPGGAPYVASHFGAQNDVQGIGKSLFDNTTSFGSSGRVQGVVHAIQYGTLLGGPSLHEILHQWANDLDTNTFPTANASHWGASSVRGTLGGWNHSTFVDLGGGNYQVNSFSQFTGPGNSIPYANLELYLMGMVPPQDVSTTYVAIGFSNYSQVGTNATFTASYISNVTIETIVSANGARVPDTTNAQKNFKIMHVLLTKAEISNALWADIDEETYYFDVDGTNNHPVLYNFWEATGGRGTVEMNNLSTSLLVAAGTPQIVAYASLLEGENCAPTNGSVDPGETVTVSFGLRNVGSGGTTNIIATPVANASVIGVSSSQSYGALSPGGTAVYRAVTFTALGTCGGSITSLFNVADGTNSLGSVSFVRAVGATSGTTQNFDGVTAPALPAGWTTSASGVQSNWITTLATPDSSPNAAFSADPSNIGVNELVSPTIQVQSASATLTFRNKYHLDFDGSGYYDGGVLEIKIGAGSFADILSAGGSFAANGYVGVLSSSWGNPLAGRSAWSGDSAGYVTTVVNLPAAAAGQPVQFRWRCATDNSVSFPGWWIDNVVFGETACCSTPQDIVQFVAPTRTNLTVYSVGAQAGVAAEYTTNLLGAQDWLPITNGATVWNNGTNVTTFGTPTNLPQYIIRLINGP